MRLILFSFFFLSCASLFAQIKKQATWQQRVDYVIHVTLDDVNHTLSATETITYTNNSPDELKELYFHLWANAYKNNETAFAKQQLENGKTKFQFADDDERGWIDNLDFKINNEKVEWMLTDNIDIAKITLSKPLKSGESIVITTPFKVKIPQVFSRMGHEEQLYCITQWYPKPAVYDVNGWNPMPYLDQGEFYSEFGKFDVSITVPENYIVAATGNLQNEDEQQKLLELSKEKFPSKNDYDKSFPPSSTAFKTLRYVQDSIHDFAWFADKRFKVERSEVILQSGKKVATWFFSPNPKESVVHWMDTAVSFYSRLVGEYPYAHATGVYTPLLAGGGMEYPTITNISSVGRQVIVHEVGHNWFYGILGNNERAYPWMDESINNYYEARSDYKQSLPKYDRLVTTIKALSINMSSTSLLQLEYLLSARKNDDQKPFLHSTEFTDFNYGTIVYGKAALAFLHLQQYLGDSAFDGMMQAYYSTWKFKHPLPDDFIEHAKNYTGKNLDWFFEDLMNDTKKQDYKLSNVKKKSIVREFVPNLVEYSVTVKNKGKVTAPFSVSVINKDSAVVTKWFEGFKGKQTLKIQGQLASKLRIDAYEQTSEVYRNNNTIRTSGLFKTWQKSKFQFLGNLENPYANQIFFTPVIGANLYNKTMLGIAFYNSILPKKKTEYLFVPMYAFGSKDLAGYGEISRQIATPSKWLKDITLGLKAARFAFNGNYIESRFSNLLNVPIPWTVYGLMSYEKAELYLHFRFRKTNERTDANKSLVVRHSMINEQKHTASLFNSFDKHFAYTTVTFSLDKNRKINSYKAQAHYQYGKNTDEFQKVWGEASTFLNYNSEKKGFYARGFAGSFIQKPIADSRPFFRTGNNGNNDYLFEQSQFGRSEDWSSMSLFGQQLLFGDLQFKELYPNAFTNSWATAANIETTIPGIIPIRIYADFALLNAYSTITTTAGTQEIYENTFLYTGGFAVVLFNDLFRVNFPVVASQEIQDYFKGNNGFTGKSYGERISFSLNLNKINPLKRVRGISF